VRQLFELAPRLQLPADRVWVTIDSAQTRSLLAGERVFHLLPSKPRDVGVALRNALSSRSLFRSDRVDVVVSTGSSTAAAVLPVAAAHRVRTIYIESATRVNGPSAAGRLMELLPGVATYTQHDTWDRRGWTYAGSIFDAFDPEPLADGPPVRRVVVTLGSSAFYGFRRLVERLVAILPEDVEVLWQTGSTDVSGLGVEGRASMPAAELVAHMRAADVVIAHAGTGTILDALDSGKHPIVVPRSVRRGEHVDDHQEQIAADVAGRGLVMSRDADDLRWEDVVRAAGLGTRRVPAPPPLRVSR